MYWVWGGRHLTPFALGYLDLKSLQSESGTLILLEVACTAPSNIIPIFLFRWIIPVVLISILNKGVCTSSTTNL